MTIPLQVEIQHTDDHLPEEEDVYGVNEIDEYDPDYWMPAERNRYRKQVILRLLAGILALAFGLMVFLYLR